MLAQWTSQQARKGKATKEKARAGTQERAKEKKRTTDDTKKKEKERTMATMEDTKEKEKDTKDMAKVQLDKALLSARKDNKSRSTKEERTAWAIKDALPAPHTQ